MRTAVNVPKKLCAVIKECTEIRSLSEVHCLPTHAGIYIVFDGDTIFYVGRAENIRRRWVSHHRMAQLSQNPNAHIAIIEHSLSELVKAERHYINLLCPTLNRTPVNDRKRKRQTRLWPPKPRRRIRPWPSNADQIADTAIVALEKTSTEADIMKCQSKSIISIIEECITAIEDRDYMMVFNMLLSIRELAVAQQSLCVNIKDRATTHRSALAAARRGEY